MSMLLDNVEVRVLGSLVEKQVTTPEYYPLTLNALVQACNQKTNRDPVTAFDETTVENCVERLRDRNLVYVFYGSGSRVPKYKHMMRDVYEIDEAELAVVTVLMLRGAQTLGELRERASRLHEFKTLGEVEETLNSLAGGERDALVARLPRQPGQKDVRYAHLLSGQVEVASALAGERAGEATSRKEPDAERLSRLEREVERLNEEVRTLRGQLEDFKNQFG